MNNNASRTAGLAIGALAGQYPEPALGLVPAAGVFISDDFIGATGRVTSRYGEHLWQSTTIGGAPTYANVTPSASTEAGVLSLTTPALSGQGGVLRPGVTTMFRAPPAGSIWCVKLQMSTGTANYELWSGFAASTGRVAAADTTDFIGVRSIGGNLFGVVKQGASPSETTVDLGIDCEAAWRVVGFEMTATDTAQFFTLDCSQRGRVFRTDAGAAVTTNFPNTTMTPVALGLVTTTNAAAVAQIDFWSLGGRIAR